MHKDLNMVKGGDKAISRFWKSKGLTPPTLLANKDNAAVLATTCIGGSVATAPARAELS